MEALSHQGNCKVAGNEGVSILGVILQCHRGEPGEIEVFYKCLKKGLSDEN